MKYLKDILTGDAVPCEYLVGHDTTCIQLLLQNPFWSNEAKKHADECDHCSARLAQATTLPASTAA